ncbi:hypothetical protein KKC94_03810 [Patescibacteria group bacterium]|nr:hypothetical protein [Patescibacteria group bacterium]
MKSFRAICLILISAIVLVSCDLNRPTLEDKNSISIAYAEAISSYSPLDFEAKNRKYLANIYESLVRYDKSFNYDTGLSISWGRKDDYTWEFKLREGAQFHDGSAFDAEDAVYSLNLARNDPESQLGSLLSTISDVRKVDTYKIEIQTSEPDPLLLNKLTSVYMIPNEYKDFLTPMGTGPYYLNGFEDRTLTLKRFPNYYGAMPYYENVNLVFIPDIQERLDAILSGQIDVLANVPPQYFSRLEEAGIDTQVFPSLEVSYLMLNFNSALSDPNLRKAIWYALSTDFTGEVGAGFLLPTNQFAALGIFGYDPSINDRQQDLFKAQTARNMFEGDVNLNLYVPIGLDDLGYNIANDLKEISVNVTVNVLDMPEFQQEILSGDADMYFFGWKYDLADVSDFFETVIHSKDQQYGEFNGINYANSEVDDLIEKASQILNVQQRRKILGEITDLILDDTIAVPLFESEVVYGFSPDVHWSVRLDGQILASEILGNVVQY